MSNDVEKLKLRSIEVGGFSAEGGRLVHVTFRFEEGRSVFKSITAKEAKHIVGLLLSGMDVDLGEGLIVIGKRCVG